MYTLLQKYHQVEWQRFISYRAHREKKLRRKQYIPSLPRGQY